MVKCTAGLKINEAVPKAANWVGRDAQVLEDILINALISGLENLPEIVIRRPIIDKQTGNVVGEYPTYLGDEGCGVEEYYGKTIFGVKKEVAATTRGVCMDDLEIGEGYISIKCEGHWEGPDLQGTCEGCRYWK